MEQKLGDLKVSGAGSVGGGKFNEVKISGAGNIKGDIECNVFKTSGASEVVGNVKAKYVDVSGASEIKGNLESEEIKVSGASKIKGNVATKLIRVSGSSAISGGLSAEEVEISGAVDIKEDCEAERFKASGGFDIGGLLNAGDIEINVYGRCRAREIGGEKIDVRKGHGNLFGMMLGWFTNGDKLVTGVIEGDEIYLENTQAKVVRGGKITIGQGCSIDIVEYRDSINVSNDAVVKEQKKIV